MLHIFINLKLSAPRGENPKESIREAYTNLLEKTRVQELTELPLGADFHSPALTFFNLFSLLHRLIQIQQPKTITMVGSVKMSTARKRS